MVSKPNPSFILPADSEESICRWLAESLSRLMAEQQIGLRQQATLLSELCGISPSQARRKLNGATWSFSEVLAVARRFGFSLDQIASGAPNGGFAFSHTADLSPTLRDARFVTESLSVPCQVLLGVQCISTPTDNSVLLAAASPEGWLVGARDHLVHYQAEVPFHYAEQVLLKPDNPHQLPKIAILDDEKGVSETLCDWFAATGYEAVAFTSGEALLATDIEAYVAFIVDFVLATGDSSQTIVRALRQSRPDVPIMLLTGKLRSGEASEAELTALLRSTNVTFFEKPVRPSVVAAAIETQLSSLANHYQE